MKQTHKILAHLYLCLFNIGEEGADNMEDKIQPISEYLVKHNEPGYDDYVPDEEGAPMTSSREVYGAYYLITEEGLQDEESAKELFAFTYEWLDGTEFTQTRLEELITKHFPNE